MFTPRFRESVRFLEVYSVVGKLDPPTLSGLIAPKFRIIDDDATDRSALEVIRVSIIQTIWLPALSNFTRILIISPLPALTSLSAITLLTYLCLPRNVLTIMGPNHLITLEK